MGNNALRHYYKPFYKHFDRFRYKVTKTKMAGLQG